MTDLDRQANVLGALSLVVHDRTRDAIAAAVGEARAETAAAALSALYHFLERPNIDMLRQVLGLTPSGAVRLVDRLVEAGYVTRERAEAGAPGASEGGGGGGRADGGRAGDRRSRVIALTPAGRRAAERVADARAGVLRAALDPLTDAERATFEQLIGRVLAGFARGPGATRWICRLCDTDACERRESRCPIAQAAANRYGAAAVYGDRPAPS